MDIKIRTLSVTEESVLKNDSLDVQDWVDRAIDGKVNNCKKRMLAEWLPKLYADGSVNSIPASEDEIVAMIVARSDYKNRFTREFEITENNNNEQGESSNEQEEPDSGGDASSESSGEDSGGVEGSSSDSSDASSGTSEASEPSSDDGNESAGSSGSDASADSEAGSGGDDSEGSDSESPSGDPSSEWTKDQLKAYMDSNSIEYNSGDTKQDLLDKITLAGEGPIED